MSNWSFLVSHAGNPNMLDACLDSIKKFYPDERIIVSVRDEPYAGAAQYLAETRYGATVVKVPGNGDNTHEVLRTLMLCAPSQYAVHMEADCLLLKDLWNLRAMVEAGSFVGVEEKILWPSGRDGNRLNEYYFRYAPGFHTASFFMIDVNRFFREFGNNAISFKGHNPGWCHEPYYGISDNITKAGWGIHNLIVSELPHKFGFSMLYETHVLHTWFGAWRLRGNVQSASGVDPNYLRAAEANVLAEYWSGGDYAQVSNGFLARDNLPGGD